MFHLIKRILPMRSMKRHKATGEMLVHVMWTDNSVTVEPLTNFYDGDRVNVHMNAIINRYKQTAMEFPFRKRHCLLCDTRVHDAMIFCEGKKCAYVKEFYE